MPIKHVYGKKTKKTGATTSAFTWSSPDKSPSTVITTTLELLESTTTKVPGDRPQEVPHETDKQTSERIVLSVRDANSVLRPEVLPPTALDEKTKKAVRRSPRLKKHTEHHSAFSNQAEKSPTKRPCTLLPSPHLIQSTPRPEHQPSHDEDQPRILTANEHGDQETKSQGVATDNPIQSLLDLVPPESRANGPIPFNAWTADLEADFIISKMTEASFAQVYLLQRKIPTGIPKEDQSILKMISLHPTARAEGYKDGRPPKVRDTSSDVSKVVSEVKLLDRMTEIPGFTNLREVNVLSGQPSAPFIAAWKEWNKKRRKNEKSYFPDPSRKANYATDQLWAVIEMDHAGLDLEHPDIKVDDVDSVWDVFWGVAITLAKGEEDVKFEHRDLHLGNVCVTQNKTAADSRRKWQKLGASGLETTLIDYTLSRAELEGPVSGVEAVCVDLADEGIFDGDASENYQYDIYRFMRSAVYLDDPLGDFAACEDNGKATPWLESHLSTNVIWLHYLLHELWPKVEQAEATTEPEDVEQQGLQATKREVLLELLEQLRLENWKSSDFRSAKDLVLTALDRGWLDPEHISGEATDVDCLTQGLSKLDLLKDSPIQSYKQPEANGTSLSRPRRGRWKDSG